MELARLFHFVGDNEGDTFEETTDHSCCRQHRHYSARLVIRITSFLTSLLSCVVRVFFFLLITGTYPYISSSRTHQHGFYTNSADTRQPVSLNLIICCCCCCYYHFPSHTRLSSDLIVGFWSREKRLHTARLLLAVNRRNQTDSNETTRSVNHHRRRGQMRTNVVGFR